MKGYTPTPAPKPAAKAPAPKVTPKHRLAGSHDGLYITEHHRGAPKK